jgi:hypothetical protein
MGSANCKARKELIAFMQDGTMLTDVNLSTKFTRLRYSSYKLFYTRHSTLGQPAILYFRLYIDIIIL